MSDSIQKPITEGCGSQTPPQENSKDESADGEHNNMTPPSGGESGKPKPVKIVLIFAAFEAGGYVFSEIADGVEGYTSVFVHWLSICCAAAGFFAAWHEIDAGKKAFKIWMSFGFASIFLALIAYLVWRPHKQLATDVVPPKMAVPAFVGSPQSEPNVTLETLGVIPKWSPPELPKGVAFIFIRFGGCTLGWQASLIATNPSESGIKVPGLPIQIPISPYIKNNHLYVAVKSLLRTNLETVFLNEDLGYPLPQNWDRNYNSNAFEIVSEDRQPVLQITYLAPNMVQVNGIFFITEKYGVVAFGDGFSATPFPIDKGNVFFTQRKPWFVYPSRDHIAEVIK